MMLDGLKKNKRFMEGAFYIVLLVGLIVLDKVFSLAMELLPLAGMIIAAAYLKKKATPAQRTYIPAIVVQAGHYLWITVVYLVTGQLFARIIDLLVMTLGLRWLLRRPGIGPATLLSVYNILLLISYTPALRAGLQANNVISVKAIALHVILAVLSVVFMIFGLVKAEKTERDKIVAGPDKNGTNHQDEDENENKV